MPPLQLRGAATTEEGAVACLSPRGRGIITYCWVLCCHLRIPTNIHSSSLHHYYDPLEVSRSHGPRPGGRSHDSAVFGHSGPFGLLSRPHGSPLRREPALPVRAPCAAHGGAVRVNARVLSSPVPFQLTAQDVSFFENLGPGSGRSPKRSTGCIWTASRAGNLSGCTSISTRASLRPCWSMLA